MKKLQNIKFVLLIASLSVIGVSCNKEDIDIDPRKAILGKWEKTHRGDNNKLRPIENPSAYQEYLTDSVLLT